MTYSEMKDSGVPSIGLIPSNWTNSYFGRIATVKPNLVSPFDYPDDIQVSPENIEKDSGILLNYKTVADSGVISWNHLFHKGQILYSKIRPALNKVTVAPFDGLCSADMYPIETSHHTRFVLYLMQSHYFVEQVSMITGNRVKMPKVNQAELSRIAVVLPPKDDEEKIAAYLDEVCATVNSIIDEAKTSIEEYRRWKASVIYQAVTKGLNPDFSMKDSNVQWIGKIPSDWTLSKMAFLYAMRNEKVSDKEYPPLSVTMKGIVPQLATAAKTDDGDNRKLVKVGDFAINSRSDRRGSCGISSYEGSVSLINTVLIPRNQMNPEYYNWLFHSELFADEFYRCGHGIVDDLWTTRWQEMKHIIVPVPSLPEQERIAHFLNTQCAKIDSVVSEKQSLIAELEAYKKSLIYEAVTGKRKVG